MRLKFILLLLFFMLLPTFSWATMQQTTQPMAAPGSTQLVTIMNSLANPAAIDLTKTNVMIKYYDGSGTHPPCWIENNVAYHNDPDVVGAGGRNGCGKGTSPQAIVKIDILALKAI